MEGAIGTVGNTGGIAARISKIRPMEETRQPDRGQRDFEIRPMEENAPAGGFVSLAAMINRRDGSTRSNRGDRERGERRIFGGE